MSQISFFSTPNDPAVFFDQWRNALADEYDNEDTYVLNPTANGYSAFLYGSLFFRITRLKTTCKISIPAALLSLPNAPQPPCFAQARQTDFLTAALDCAFDFEAFADWSRKLKPLVFRTLGNESFACCNDFVRCSDEKACLHPHEVFYNHCAYRENLEAGRIFYGKNANK